MRETATICLRPCKLTISSYFFARWHLFRHVSYLRHQQQVDLWPFDLESGVKVTCDVGYLCANFSLPRLLYSRLMPDVRDKRQTASSLNASCGGGGIIINTEWAKKWHRCSCFCAQIIWGKYWYQTVTNLVHYTVLYNNKVSWKISEKTTWVVLCLTAYKPPSRATSTTFLYDCQLHSVSRWKTSISHGHQKLL